MSDILNKHLVLVLNSVWQPIGYISIKKAIIAMFSTNDGQNMAAKALNLEYPLDENGFINFKEPLLDRVYPVGIPEWNDLPIRDFDIPIHTSKRIIRAPIVIIANNYSKVPMKRLKPTKRNIYDFYKGKCIWTGRTLSLNEATLEHMNPRSNGGQNTWQNLGLSGKKENNERGNIPIKDWKYKQQYPLKEPKSIPISALITKPARPEWEYFLIKK